MTVRGGCGDVGRDILTPMNYRKELAFRCIMLFAIAGLAPLLAADNEYSRRSLAGITALGVVVENLSSGAGKIGLTKNAIQTDVELKLRQAGIRVGSELEFLYIAVTVTDDGHAAYVGVELHQPVKLAHDPIPTSGSTWSRGTLTTKPTAQEIRSVIKDEIDKFLNAWLSMNPKK
jgi:hypothetical protein